MPRKPKGVLILGLIAVLISFTAANATRPIAKEIPDIRNNNAKNGVAKAAVLDLDDYVVDPDDVDTNGLQDMLDWSMTPIDEASIEQTANELFVGVAASEWDPKLEVTNFTVSDALADQAFSEPVAVHTVVSMIGAPLVDDYLVAGGVAGSQAPYSWCIDDGQSINIPVGQPGGGGRVHVMVSSGMGETSFQAGDTIADASDQLMPIGPYDDGVALKGLKFGPFDGSDVSLEAANLSIDAGINGLWVTGLTGFSDWVRISVTRHYNFSRRLQEQYKVSTMNDCYTVAICDILETPASALSGDIYRTDQTKTAAESTYQFENVTVAEFLGAANSSAFEADVEAGLDAQKTGWAVSTHAAKALDLDGTTLPEIDITADMKPPKDFPGATSGRALKLTFDAEDNQGVLMASDGIDPADYEAGDVLTLSLNAYVDLNYDDGSVSADEINEASNGLHFYLALLAEPFAKAGVVNYLTVAVAEDAYDDPIYDTLDLGQHAQLNHSAIMHGKWTRQMVSYRVPELGKAVTGGPSGAASANILDPAGISAKILVARVNTGLNLQQEVWLDNICVSRCPGALNLAHGAVNCPMISAGWNVQYAGGTEGTEAAFNLGAAIPAALARGEVVNGNFSTNNGTATSVAPMPAGVAAFFRHGENAAAGWVDERESTDAAFISEGAGTIALGFPVGYNQSLCLTPAIANNWGSPSHTGIADTGHPGSAASQSPYLDMRLASEASLPGLRVNDVSLGGATTIQGNVSGVYGIRWFARTNGADPADNPFVNMVVSNADFSLGFVAQQPPQCLPNGADSAVAGTVWADSQAAASVLTFNSGRQYELLVNLDNNGQGNPDAGLRADLAADNPGAQLAQVTIFRSNPGNQADIRSQSWDVLPQIGYKNFLGTHTGTPSTAQIDATPGRYCTATAFIDQVGLYTVRDVTNFFDKDLCYFDLVPADVGEPVIP